MHRTSHCSLQLPVREASTHDGLFKQRTSECFGHKSQASDASSQRPILQSDDGAEFYSLVLPKTKNMVCHSQGTKQKNTTDAKLVPSSHLKLPYARIRHRENSNIANHVRYSEP